MKNTSKSAFLLSLLWLTACASQTRAPAPGSSTATPKAQPGIAVAKLKAPAVITKRAELSAHVGRLITLRGVVANSKIPTLLGVDVASDSPDLRGQRAEATGILRRTVVTRAQLEARIRKYGMFANRGAGTFYRLVNAGTKRTAQVRSPR